MTGLPATPEDATTFIALVAFAAGLIRGFTGFGGPAFMLVVLTIFYTPLGILSKVLVIDYVASVYLLGTNWKHVDWQAAFCMAVPTVLLIPVGHWLLLANEPEVMRRVMAVVVAVACVLLLTGVRYTKPLSWSWLVAIGCVAGLIFGATYVALLVVVAILLGPFDKNTGRALIIAWAIMAATGYAITSWLSGTMVVSDVVTALPAAMAYLAGTWLGSLGFQQASERLFRNIATATLLGLSLFNVLY